MNKHALLTALLLTLTSASQADNLNDTQRAILHSDPYQSAYQQAQQTDADQLEKITNQPYQGLTLNQTPPIEDLYSIEEIDASTRSLTQLAKQLYQSLSNTPTQNAIQFPLTSPNWRTWRADAQPRTHGISLLEMDKKQRKTADKLLKELLSIEGYEEVSSIIKLSATTGELLKQSELYNEQLYWFTFFGEPSTDQPWGLQIDGNHLTLNLTVIGNQLSITPFLLEAEPTLAPSGTQNAGETALQFKRDAAFKFIRALDDDQRKSAILANSKRKNQLLTGAFNDNLDLPTEGLSAETLNNDQKQQLLKLISLWTGDLRDKHANNWLKSIENQLDQTHIVWIGGTKWEDPYYLRILNPLILIEFDHQSSEALKTNPNYRGKRPRNDHIISLIRQPNGNDYGKALLKAYNTQSND